MRRRTRKEWADEEILQVLHLRDHDKLPMRDIATSFGVSRASIIGMTNRISIELERTDPDGNQNGTMPPKWWQNRMAHT
ncbi:hypothetical protein KM176_16670 [Pseudooceanicola sp. CBS1P-1]|uniref:HTH psq-type domain-containing protein n=1 Tax=Pseudooceanicola albus TaxID=2692189 RepID=A0A6L7G6E2_9RHOB|nr:MULTISPECIES: hypothetical protein [Pseudooceanicola]MBT9385510.1 hypothetical protein [Pseudooceanicola endophyticus]MXN19078.1 hypothetical protein [Pseudooceanicola albus]